MKNVYLKAFCAGLLYPLMQGLSSVILLSIGFGTVGRFKFLVITLPLSCLLTCGILWWRGFLHVPECINPSSIRWKLVPLAVVAAVLGAAGTNLLAELLKLDDLIGPDLLQLFNMPLGVLAIAVVGPIAEEFIFREGVQGVMLRAGITPWKTILFSAFIFGVIHLNPIQVFFAFVLGIILGLIYYCTRSIVVTSLIHILNNSIAVIEARCLGDKASDFSYSEWLGLEWSALLLLAIGLLLGSCALLWWYWKKECPAPELIPEEAEPTL